MSEHSPSVRGHLSSYPGVTLGSTRIKSSEESAPYPATYLPMFTIEMGYLSCWLAIHTDLIRPRRGERALTEDHRTENLPGWNAMDAMLNYSALAFRTFGGMGDVYFAADSTACGSSSPQREREQSTQVSSSPQARHRNWNRNRNRIP